MLLIPTDALHPGMTVAHPVFHPDRDDLVLLNPGFELNDEMIRGLQEHGVLCVWIHVPGLEEVDRHVNERIARSHFDLLRVLNNSIDTLERRVQVQVNVDQYQRAVHGMLSEIVDDPDHDIVTHQLTQCGPRLAGHMANCSYLALLLGAHLSGYVRQERRALPPDVANNTALLGLGALLHDIGKLNMPDDVRSITALLPEASWEEYQLHVQTGYQQVRSYISPIAANIVLHHHERFDGRGFPGRLSTATGAQASLAGSNIHVFSRIVAVVDAFDHLLCPNGQPVPTIVAINAIRSGRFEGWFDPVIVEALLRLVPPFTVGSIVTLSDGRDAAVVANHPEAPCKPTVRPLGQPIAEGLSPVGDRYLDLRMSRKLSISHVKEFDVRPYLYNGEFEPPSAASAA